MVYSDWYFPHSNRTAPAIGRKASETGIQIARFVARGQTLKELATTCVMDTLQEGIKKIVQSEKNQSRSGIRSNHNRRKRRKIDIFS